MSLDQLCKVSEHAWRTGGAPSGRGATMFAAIKSDIAVEDLLKGLLVHNGNDAAIILAECLDGSEEAFAGRMTSLAEKIGMKNSRFANPTGYAEKPSQTSVRDQALLAEYIVETHPDLYQMFQIPEFTWNKIFQRNKNPLLGEIRNLDGLGGGNDPEDGYSGLGSVDRNGRRVIASVAGLTSDKHRLQTLKEVIWKAPGSISPSRPSSPPAKPLPTAACSAERRAACRLSRKEDVDVSAAAWPDTRLPHPGGLFRAACRPGRRGHARR